MTTTLQTCDACNNGITQGRYRIEFQSGLDLVLCAHHRTKHSSALLKLKVRTTQVIDEDGHRVLDIPVEPLVG